MPIGPLSTRSRVRARAVRRASAALGRPAAAAPFAVAQRPGVPRRSPRQLWPADRTQRCCFRLCWFAGVHFIIRAFFFRSLRLDSVHPIGGIRYEASSPDEAALVGAADRFGWKFYQKTNTAYADARSHPHSYAHARTQTRTRAHAQYWQAEVGGADTHATCSVRRCPIGYSPSTSSRRSASACPSSPRTPPAARSTHARTRARARTH